MKASLLTPRVSTTAIALAVAAGLSLVQAPSEAAQPGRTAFAPSAAVMPVANWHNPYGNIDRRNDAGNDTGDSQVDSLNQGQLNQNYRGPYYYPNGQPAQGMPPPGYAPPAQPYGAPYPPPPSRY